MEYGLCHGYIVKNVAMLIMFPVLAAKARNLALDTSVSHSSLVLSVVKYSQ